MPIGERQIFTFMVFSKTLKTFKLYFKDLPGKKFLKLSHSQKQSFNFSLQISS